MALPLLGLASSALNSGSGKQAGITTGEVRQAVENALNQNNTVFVGGSGNARNVQSTGEPLTAGNNAPLYILGGIAIIGLLATLKNK